MAGHNPSGSTLGTLLRELRQSQNRSLETVAGPVSQAAGASVTRDQVQSWEAGTDTPGPTDLGHLAIALEVPLLLLDGALAEAERAAKRVAKSVNSADDYGIGRRVRQLRNWRGLSVRAAAGLAGISGGYLSAIEHGYRAVTKRSLLEALANALRVSPADLTDKPWERVASPEDARMDLTGIESTLDAYELGDDPGMPAREWPEVEGDVKRLVDLMHVHADFIGQAELAPTLLGELHALYVRDSKNRQAILLGLIRSYHAAMYVTKRIRVGSNSLALMAAIAAQRCAEELESPQWRGIASWLHGYAAGSLNRDLQYQRAVQMADELRPVLGDPEVAQTYGLLHLSAALAAAAQSNRDGANTHLDEATAVASRLDAEVGTFANAWFGRANVGIWRVAIGLELGDGASVAEAARGVRVQAIPSPIRQADFFADVGRSLLAEKPTREKGLALLLRAEKLAPQRTRNDVFVREAVGDAYRAARREAGSAELRGLAFRLGLAPMG